MKTRLYASAKVHYEEFGGNVELSVTHQSDSPIEFMEWLCSAVEYYRLKLQCDIELKHVRQFVIDYRFNNERASVVVGRSYTDEFQTNVYEV